MFDGRTKIIATLGPALDAEGVLERLLDSGVDVLRVNLSHAPPRDQAARVRRARAHRPDIAVLADLGGPKLRLGELREEIKIRARRHHHAGRGRRAGRRSVAVRSRARRRSGLHRRRHAGSGDHRGRERPHHLPRARGRDAALAQGHQPADGHVVAAGAHREGSHRPGRHRRARARLHRAVVRAPREGHRRRARADASCRSSPRSRSSRRWSASTRSSRPPTRSWWRAAISASRSRSRRCRRRRRG